MMKQGYGFGLVVAVLLVVAGLSGCKQEGSDNKVAQAIQQSSSQESSVESGADVVAKLEPASAGIATAEEAAPAEQLIRESLAKNLPRLAVMSLRESDAPGIYQVEINGGDIIHVTSDGKHIFNGDLLAIRVGGVENITEGWRSKKRIAALQGLKDEDLVVYQAQGEEKGEVVAFTDTSCGYCRKFHMEIPQLNAMGITVKYAAWPRYGLQSPAGQTIANIWCSKDRESAMTAAKTGQTLAKPEGECDTSAIMDQIALGHEVGVRGTPALFLPDGRKVGGYREAADLAAEFKVAGKSAAAE